MAAAASTQCQPAICRARQSLGFRGLGFRGLGFRVWGLRFRGLGFRGIILGYIGAIYRGNTGVV